MMMSRVSVPTNFSLNMTLGTKLTRARVLKDLREQLGASIAVVADQKLLRSRTALCIRGELDKDVRDVGPVVAIAVNLRGIGAPAGREIGRRRRRLRGSGIDDESVLGVCAEFVDGPLCIVDVPWNHRRACAF